MTAENNGVPEDDDPFAYLYRAENGEDGGAAPTQPMPGVPRTSYQQATQVGRTQYGGQPGYGGQQSAYGQQQPGYGQQTQQYGGVPHQAQPPAGGRAAARQSGGSGGTSRGVMIGAVAVVAAIAIGIGMALFNGDGKSNAASGSTTSASAATTPTSSASASASAGALPTITDASTMKLQGTSPVTTPPGAKAAAGSVPITNGQQSISWTVTIPTAGQYYVHIRYNNSGGEAKDLLLVNGQKSRETDFKNYGGKDPSQTWFHTYNQPDLPTGQVTITIQGVDGQPPVDIDQLTITNSSSNPWS
jgi:hypothetical protein